MTLLRSVKSGPPGRRAVGVIATHQELTCATRLRQLPDFFELRLDALRGLEKKFEEAIDRLSAPLIITARHPLEGGVKNLPVQQRRDLLLRFLPKATLVDVELRAARQLRGVLDAAAAQNVRRIISVHDFRSMPPLHRMERLLDAARAAGADIFKIATRTDTTEELDRLIAFFDWAKARMPISAMGIGKLGRQSRRILAHRGSVLNYGHLSRATAEGQLSLAEIRRLLRTSSAAASRPKPATLRS